MGIREIIYLLIGLVIIIIVLTFLGSFDEFKEGLIGFFSNFLENFI